MNTQPAAGFVITIDPAETGVFQVIDSDRLFEFTQQGWRLVAMLPVTALMKQSMPRYNPNYNDGRPPAPEPTVYGNEFHCLVRRDEQSALALKTAQIEQLTDSLNRAAEKERLAVAEVTPLRTDLEAKKTEIAALRRSDDSLRESLRQQQNKNYRIETDIGKLRKDIGEKEFTRIIGETKS